MIDETESDLLLNCSWSGSPICNTGYEGKDTSTWSFIARLDQLIESGYFTENRIDTLLILGGTNDAAAHSPIGELQYCDWTAQTLKSALPAFGYLLHRATEKLKGTRCICVFNSNLKVALVEPYRVACEHYGIEYIDLYDIDKSSGHPTVLGMAQIKDQILDYLRKNNGAAIVAAE